MTMERNAKLERLLRMHRQNVFHDDAARGARHERALHRLKRTATFRAMCSARADHAAYVASERLLRLYA